MELAAGAPDIDLTDGPVPKDTLKARLAIIRAEFDWDYEEAGRECSVGGKNWKRWEREGKLPRDIYEVVRKIHDRTGYSRKWILDGGPLSSSRCNSAPELHLRLIRGKSRQVHGQRAFRLWPR